MDGRYLLIPVPESAFGALELESAAPPRLTLEWIDANGDGIGDPLVLEPPPPVMVEVFGPSAGPRWSPGQSDIVVHGAPPADAAAARIGGPGFAELEIALEGVARQALGKPDTPPLLRGAPEAAWRLAVVADGYAELAAFEKDFDLLWEEFSGARPFKALHERGLVALVGLFWPSPDGKSLFDARRRDNNPRIIYGSTEAVNDAVAASGEPRDKILVVMNRPERGGAGGFDSSRPSWTTNVGAEHERWTQIALHELGHAFGLADEYASEGNGTAEPDPLEPNVSRDRDPVTVGWRRDVDLPRDRAPSLRKDEANPHPADSTGTFQGARYDATKYYRPSFGCRMQWTTWEFCKICSGVITKAIESRVP